MAKVILHLFADLGSDSYYYQQDSKYKVILIGKEIGVENYHPKGKIHGIIANPPCTYFSTAIGFHKERDMKDLNLVEHTQRIIEECKDNGGLKWWVLENPATGTLKKVLGSPKHTYQPWQYGDPWTKKTALWGEFNMPEPLHKNMNEVKQNEKLYVRPTRKIASLAFLHKKAINDIPQFEKFKDKVKTDADFRSLASQGFAKAFYDANP